MDTYGITYQAMVPGAGRTTTYLLAKEVANQCRLMFEHLASVHKVTCSSANDRVFLKPVCEIRCRTPQRWEGEGNQEGNGWKRRGMDNSQNKAKHCCQPVSALLHTSLFRDFPALSTSRDQHQQTPHSGEHVSNDGQVLHKEGHAALGHSPVGDNAR